MVHVASLPAELEWAATHDAGEVLARLAATEAGLTEREATARLRTCGPNTIAPNHGPHWLASLARRLAGPVNVMLIVLSALSVFVHDYSAAALIGGMIVLSVSLATWQETRSDRAVAALRTMVHTTIAVRRRAAVGNTPVAQERPIAELVPGDIIHLAAGDLIPADVRLLASKDLFINQATLTGESMPVEKFPARCTAAAQAGDLGNIALMGTAVFSGTAMAVVVLTGERAIFGHIAQSIAGQEPPTDFEAGLNRIARLMLMIIAVMSPLVFLINWLTKGDWFEAVLFAMAVGVGLAPEMLPMLVTVNLAKGAMAMSRRKVIIKRLAAIQNLGAMDTLCTDKTGTGTLTQDLVILKQHVDLAGDDSERVQEFAYLNSYFQSGLHNLLDVAVLRHEELSERMRIAQAYRLIDEIPYDFTRRRMSVVVQAPHARVLICKGAVEEVFSVCTAAELEGQRVPLDATHYRDLVAISDRLNDDGFRVIAIAFRECQRRRRRTHTVWPTKTD
ncbi:HAD-IC family P-type ATPase [Cupriavidus necator]|uniref:HAD-IC family P-type ATPase n=1 Tax=Cupriavidus necator TaxID=106590 RepID=UPI001D035882|nr:HAD-IC family P-type ATPase [Cupriavidus necator]